MREKDSLRYRVRSSRECRKRDLNNTQESPIHSWNLIGPAVVWASKSGATYPRRREGMMDVDGYLRIVRDNK